MNTKVHDLLEEAKQLSPVEQLDLIRALSESLQERYRAPARQFPDTSESAIHSTVRRTAPARSLADYAADFWPDEESIDELNDFVRQQRAADQHMETWLERFTILPVDVETCRVWGFIRAHRAALGLPISPQDAWIAATALRY